MVTTPLLSLEGVGKSFPNGTVALRGARLTVMPGSVHGLVGANGAGKSTMIKVIAGAHAPTTGTVRWKGERVVWRDPGAARSAGVATIMQHVPLAPTLTVLENVFLGSRGPWRLPRRRRGEFADLLDRVGYRIDPDAEVADLAIGERQMVAILQALATGAELVVMDEPTASLAEGERQVVFDVVRRLSAQGTAFLYVSHFLDEVLSLTDRVTVLRDGTVVEEGETAGYDEDRLVQAILSEAYAASGVGREGRRAGRGASEEGERPRSTGRDLLAGERVPAAPVAAEAPVLLSVRGLNSPAGVRDVSFDVREGEVVGIAGLLGSGRSEILHAVYGADPRARGEVLVGGRHVRRTPRAAVAAGMALVPEDRNAQGLVGAFPIWKNISLPDLPALSSARALPSERAEGDRARRAIADLGIVCPGPDAMVTELSGGNAQKVVFGKWLYGGARVFMLDEPTAGVDVGAKADILELVRRFAQGGGAVLVVSSEFEEILAVATRVLVVREGRVVAERPAHETSEEELLMLANGFDAGGEPHAA
ncbi:ribose transport system ATP-binding protein [Thermocatellispora tengchongensis]|uniref:Ribose transport system ATP-binding protein n=1 Tax=Thermocatellispora tengchongensis TaxID=1073253 RepID=A0A840PJK2_9ACTN|nr:sugar ABC transporter ATP-binding protein [Thermocatellispora tengchongensis]MBB5138093.1 ribose transport system ATP-binding protein [Thermocatellispora tengchongensis]